MAPDANDNNQDDLTAGMAHKERSNGDSAMPHDKSEEEEETDEEDDEEPKLKYASLTRSQGPVYRNGDAASTFLVAGDKMIIGTHNGNIHVISLPSFQSLRVYHAHSASITSVSISPFPPPLSSGKSEAVNRVAVEPRNSPARPPPSHVNASPSGKSPSQAPVPATPSNSIHIATSSIDGNVCVSSLVDQKDVILRNFGRPVQAVGISPEYKTDRSYLSGGLAGNLILTVGGRAGTSSTSNTTGAAAAAVGWLGTIGLGTNNGADTVLHSGEGTISAIKWSLSGKYVVWVNEQGIKIMRSNLRLQSSETELSWKRISHIDRPNLPGWEEMAGLWKARVEWVDQDGLESSDDDEEALPIQLGKPGTIASNVSVETPSVKNSTKEKLAEKLIVGWGGTIWIINVHSGGSGVGKEVGERKIARVEIATILRTDCIISGVSLYTPNLLLVLAYVAREQNLKKKDSGSQPGTPKRGVHRRQNALQPEMRIIDVVTKEEVCVADTLNVSRFESLSATDYHLGVLPILRTTSKIVAQRGALEVIGGIGYMAWDVTRDATLYPTRLFSSAASVRSGGSNGDAQSSIAASGVTSDVIATSYKGHAPHPTLLTRGMKVFIQSPYDCVLATRPTLSDHMLWLDTHEKYEEAWELLDMHPDALDGLPDRDFESSPSTPTKAQAQAQGQGSLVDFFADDSSQTTTSMNKNSNSQAEKEKRRIGEKWLQQLVKNRDWTKAGQVAGKVLGTSSSWEHWVWVFAEANRYQEITPYIPTVQLRPALPSLVYEVILGHYISHDRLRLKEVLDRWPPELYEVSSIITAIEGKLKIGEVQEDSVEGGEKGRDWRILMDGLAKLYLADGRAKDAFKCYVKLHDADAAMSLISEYRLVETISDDISGLILLRITEEQQKSAPMSELEEASVEPIRLLVDEAHSGTVRPETVISQLEHRTGMQPYLFFYFRALWNGDTFTAPNSPILQLHTPKNVNLAAVEGRSLVNDHADLAVRLFAEYDRAVFFAFLKTSQSYTLESASTICDRRQYIPELVYLLAKEGRTKQALTIIIEKLGDVSQAIAFAKEQDDPDLWNDLLDYSMNKPSFIRGLLEEVGTAIDSITLVRRIPEGLEIEGLREGLSRMIREYELQDSISEGVARVLRGEVAMEMKTLRTGQKRGVKFEVVHEARLGSRHGQHNGEAKATERPKNFKPGHCGGCGEAFFEDEKQILIGFPCGHIFHLSCFLTYDAAANLSAADLDADSSTDRARGRDGGIGPKIRHAQQLKGKVGTGCPVAVHKAV